MLAIPFEGKNYFNQGFLFRDLINLGFARITIFVNPPVL